MLKSYSNRLVSVRRVAQINAGKNTPGVVLPLSMVDNSAFSPNRLTIPLDPVYPSF